MKSREVASQIRNLLDYLANAEIAVIANAVVDDGRRVTWCAGRDCTGELFRQPEPTFNEYLGWLRAGAYSAVLLDGSLLQITYDFADGRLCGHRLAYVPCPFALDPELVRTEPLVDLVAMYAEHGLQHARLRSSVRFDFDPDAQRPGHAAAHASWNSTSCRIPCVSAIGIGRFSAFVFQNFYELIWRTHSYLRELPRREISPRTITSEEEAWIHLAWRNTHG